MIWRMLYHPGHNLFMVKETGMRHVSNCHVRERPNSVFFTSYFCSGCSARSRRKKGLNGHYENAHGNPQPRKVVNPVAPVRSDHPTFLPLLMIAACHSLSLLLFFCIYNLYSYITYVLCSSRYLFCLLYRRQVLSVTTIPNIVPHGAILSPCR